MSKIVPAVDHFRLGASAKHNTEALELHLRGRMNAGWTLRAAFQMDGEVYLIFAKKVKSTC